MNVIDDGSNELKEIRGDHLEGRINANVRALGIQNSHQSNLRQIATKINQFFPNLLYIYWLSSNLTDITADDLQQFPNLRVLSLESNRIQSLDAGLFQHNPHLQYIDFSRNLIQRVGLDIFKNLADLEEARFVDNPCISDAGFTPRTLDMLKTRLVEECHPDGITTSTTTSTVSPMDTTTDAVGRTKSSAVIILLVVGLCASLKQ